MILYETLRKLNHKRKAAGKEKAGQWLSPVRRIERVHPIGNRRVCAMTFDDGPSALIPSPNRSGLDKGLTAQLIAVLGKYDAKGTFDVIGTTAENYPDKCGKRHTASWGGSRHDHYPVFGKDDLAGAENQTMLIKALHAGGHEVTNHSYHHVLFGPIHYIYRKRYTFNNLFEVADDLSKLHSKISNTIGVDMKFGRPPHYIDKIKDGFDAYDAYALMGYHYLAASYDGGGWLPTTGDYDKDVDAMVKPLEKLLSENPNALNGQIVFQKDGCNMSLETPIVDALPRQLEILKRYGYDVVTVSELMALSPFEDCADTIPEFEDLCAMDAAGYIIGYKNNTFKPDKILTMGELITMGTNRSIYRGEIPDALKYQKLFKNQYGISYSYKRYIDYARSEGYLSRLGTIDSDEPVTLPRLVDYASAVSKIRRTGDIFIDEPKGEYYTRIEVIPVLRQLFLS